MVFIYLPLLTFGKPDHNIFFRYVYVSTFCAYHVHPYLSSISWSFLWAASISMQELSISGWGGTERVCRKFWFSGKTTGAKCPDLSCCEANSGGGQQFAEGQSTRGLLHEFPVKSIVNLLFLALHALWKRFGKFTHNFIMHVLSNDLYLEIVTYSSSTLFRFFRRHRASQLL